MKGKKNEIMIMVILMVMMIEKERTHMTKKNQMMKTNYDEEKED